MELTTVWHHLGLAFAPAVIATLAIIIVQKDTDFNVHLTLGIFIVAIVVSTALFALYSPYEIAIRPHWSGVVAKVMAACIGTIICSAVGMVILTSLRRWLRL